MAEKNYLFWFNLGRDLENVLSSSFLKYTRDGEVVNGYKKLKEHVVMIKRKILDGRLGEKNVKKLEVEYNYIMCTYRNYVKKYRQYNIL